MNMLQDILIYVRRIIKSPSNAVITDALLIDYINRFWLMDVDARIQLFDLKTKYQFMTVPGIDQYNMPLYSLQYETTNPSQSIGMFPVYQGFFAPMYINGIQVPLQTQKNEFFNIWANVVQQANIISEGNGDNTYTLTFPIAPNNSIPVNTPVNYILRGHADITGIIDTGNNIDPPVGTTLSNTAGVVNIPYTSINPAVYFSTVDGSGNPMVVSDSGQFIQGSVNNGMLISTYPGNSPYPFGYSALPGGYLQSAVITGATQATQAVLTAANSFSAGESVLIAGVIGMTQLNGNTYTIVSATPTTITLNVNSTGFTAYSSGGTASTLQNTINYLTGTANVTFPAAVPPGVNINALCYYFQTGLPRACLFYNNVLTFRSPPDQQYLVEVDAYLSPTAFMQSTQAIPFGYMTEYIARGAARKILADTGDMEQFQFYEPLFREQEILVWKRSQRQFTASRTETIYSQGINQGQSGYNNIGGSTF